mmetsp:Transcript_63652/g.153721  ORF Transcript_63652/g.153721 Transcript_63652/m.153721 type:complete len:213 (+) Transcript_63652:371-1009(+)
MIGTSIPIFLMAIAALKPSMTFMRRSISTSVCSPGSENMSCSSACSPCSAWSLEQPSCLSMTRRTSAHMVVSSTTSTCGLSMALRPVPATHEASMTFFHDVGSSKARDDSSRSSTRDDRSSEVTADGDLSTAGGLADGLDAGEAAIESQLHRRLCAQPGAAALASGAMPHSALSAGTGAEASTAGTSKEKVVSPPPSLERKRSSPPSERTRP